MRPLIFKPKKQKMKKILSLLAIAGTMSIVACGPSAEELAAEKKRIEDSIASFEKMRDDSIASYNKVIEDSIAAFNNNKAAADSLAAKMAADSIAALAVKTKPAPKPKPKTIPEKIKEETKKATQGRG